MTWQADPYYSLDPDDPHEFHSYADCTKGQKILQRGNYAIGNADRPLCQECLDLDT